MRWGLQLPHQVFFYISYRGSTAREVKNEFAQWQQLCLKLPTDKRPATPLEALDIIPDRLRNITILLWIFATLPVSNMHCREIVQRLEDRKELPA